MNLSWVFTVAGLAFYELWNVLVLLWGIFVIVSLLHREQQQPEATERDVRLYHM